MLEGWSFYVLVVVGVVVFVRSIEFLLTNHSVQSQKKEATEFMEGKEGRERTAVKGKTYLCLVNPFSGTQNGLFLFQNVTKPMLEMAGAREVLCIVTKKAGHFGELGKKIGKGLMLLRGETEKEEKKKEWEWGEKKEGEGAISLEVLRRLDGVLIFGGDGSLFEFMNGAVGEVTKGSFELKSEEVKYLLERLVVGVVPCGTGNGIAASYGARSAVEATKKIVLGRRRRRRKGEEEEKEEEEEEKEKEKEKEKKEKKEEGEKGGLNEQRSNVSGYDVSQVEYYDEIEKKTKRLIDVHYVSWGFVVHHDDIVERYLRSWGNIKMIIAPALVIAQQKLYHGSLSFLPALPYTPKKALTYANPTPLPNSLEEGKKDWKVLDGPFHAVSIGCLSWAAHDCCISNELQFDDGELAFLVIRGGISRIQTVLNFLALGVVGGAHGAPFMEIYNCRKVSLRARETGHFGASGENIPATKSVDVSVCPSLARFLKD